MWPSIQRIKPPSFDLNVEPLDSLDVDERPPLTGKLAKSQHHAQFLVTIFMNNQLQFATCANVIKSMSHVREAQ